MVAFAAVLGAASLAQGVLGAFSASAEASRKQEAFRREEFLRMQNASRQQYNTIQANVAKSRQNRRLGLAAAEQYGKNEVLLQNIYDQQTQEAMRNYSAFRATTESALTGKNIDPTSGTGKAIKRQNMKSMYKNLKAIKFNEMKAFDRNAEEYANQLARMDFSQQQPDVYHPGVYSGPTPGAALTSGLINAGLGGIGSYAGAQVTLGNTGS